MLVGMSKRVRHQYLAILGVLVFLSETHYHFNKSSKIRRPPPAKNTTALLKNPNFDVLKVQNAKPFPSNRNYPSMARGKSLISCRVFA